MPAQITFSHKKSANIVNTRLGNVKKGDNVTEGIHEKGEEKGGILDMIFERVKAISLTCNNQTLNSSNGNNVMTSRAPEQTVDKEGGVTRLVE